MLFDRDVCDVWWLISPQCNAMECARPIFFLHGLTQISTLLNMGKDGLSDR
eukprot:m.221174 g.221174  ORF g.221174 m.221174 type:complete len:51 (+) comp22285_c0_seq4:716-868(+)